MSQTYRSNGFSAPNKFLEKQWQKQNYELHKQKLKHMKSALDIKPPQEFLHLRMQMKTIQNVQERQAEIDKGNRAILERLVEIKQGSGRVDNWNSDWKPRRQKSGNGARQRAMERIEKQNKKQNDRLQKLKPYYNFREMEKDYEKHLYYQSILEKTTKDFDGTTTTNEDEEEEEGNGENDSEEELKLPPIKDAFTDTKEDENVTEKYDEQDAIKDAEEIRSAIEDEDKSKILEVFARVRDREKLQTLCEKYKEKYDTDLMEDVKPVVGDDVQDVLDIMLDSSKMADDYAETLYDAMKGVGTDEDTLVKVLCSKSNKELADIREAYREKYGRSLEEDLKSDTSGDLERLVVELSKGKRDQSKKADKKLAQSDAIDLIEAGAKCWGTDEGKFIEIFTKRSYVQLGATFPEYKKLTNVDIEETIDNEMDGDLQKAFLATVQSVKDPGLLQREQLRKAIETGDTKTVSKIILATDKEQINELRSSYRRAYKTSLIKDVEQNCGGQLKVFLMEIINKGGGSYRKLGKDKSKRNKLPLIHKQGKKWKEATAAGKKSKKDKEKGEEEYTDKDAEKDCDEVQKAIKDANKGIIVDILAKNCVAKSRLNKLSAKYNKKYKKDMRVKIKPLMEEGVQKALDLMMASNAELDAKNLNDAIKGFGTDEDTIIEILITRNNSELAEIKKVYQQKYGKSLEDDIAGDTSGHFEKLLVELSKGLRREDTKPDKELAKKDAEALFQAGAKAWGTDEEKFVEVFTKRSLPQLNAMYEEYKKIAGVDMEESIKSEMTGDLENGLLAIMKYSRDPKKYKDGKLVKALESENKDTLAETIFKNDKAILKEASAAYKRSKKTNLEDDIEKKVQGDLQALMLAKLGKKKKSQAQGKKNEYTDKDAEKDSEEVQKAIKDSNKKKIVDVLAKNCADKSRLDKLSGKYQKKYKKDMRKEIKPLMEEGVQKALDSMLAPNAERDAKRLNDAMKGLGTDEDALIEILSTRSNAELAEIRKTYKEKYGKSLEDDIADETSGDFQKLLVELSKGGENLGKRLGEFESRSVKRRDEARDFHLLETSHKLCRGFHQPIKGKRSEETQPDKELAKKDAEALFQAGAKSWGTDEEKFVEIFTKRSIPQLNAMYEEYKKIAGVDMEESIKSEMTGDMEKGLLAIMKYSRDPKREKDDKVAKALESGNTDALAETIFNTDQASLKEASAAYKKSKKTNLEDDIEKKVQGDLQTLMLAKLGKKKSKKGKEEYTDKEAEKDCDEIQKAIKEGNKKKIVDLLAKNCADKSRLDKLCAKFKKKYKKDMGGQIKPLMEEGVQKALGSMLASSAELDAKCLNDAIKGLGTDEDALIEILSTRSNSDLAEIRKAYQQQYGKSLEDAIASDTSGDFKKLLVELSKGKRSEETQPDKELAKKDAEALHEAGAKSWGTDEDKFIEIFTERSLPQLNAMCEEYKKIAGVDMEESIKSEMTGDMEKGLLALMKYSRDPKKQQDEKLAKALENENTDALAETIFKTDQESLKEASAAYKKSKKTKLEDDIEKKVQGDLQTLMLAKLGKKKKEIKGKGKEEYTDKDADKDCDEIEKAIKEGNKKKIVDILAKTCADKSRLDKLCAKFKKKYKKDMRGQIEPLMEEGVQKALGSMLASSAELDAKCLNDAIKGVGTDEDALIEILSTRTNSDLAEIKKVYQQKYGKSLEDAIESETSGDFQKLLVELSKGSRSEETQPDKELAKKDAEALFEAGAKSWGTDEDKFVEIFTKRSLPQLNAMYEEYKKIAGVDMEESIKSEMSGDMEKGLLALIKYSRDPKKQKDEKLAKALENDNTDALAETVFKTDQESLKEASAAYKQSHKTNLEDDIEKKVQGDLQTLMLAKLGKSKEEGIGVTDYSDKNAAKDSDALRQAIKAKDKDEAVEILANICSNKANVGKLCETYQQKYGQDLLEDLKPIMEEDVQEALDYLLVSNTELDAKCLHDSMKGFGIDEDALIEILTTRNNAELAEIRKVYENKYGRSLESDIEGETVGDFERLLVELSKGSRSETTEIDEELAMNDAEILYKTAKYWKLDMNRFIEFFTKRSVPQLNATYDDYKKLSLVEMEELVESEMTGDMEKALLALMRATRDANKFKCDNLTTAIQNEDENALAKMVFTGSKRNLPETLALYNEENETELVDDIEKTFDGDLQTLLLAALGKKKEKVPKDQDKKTKSKTGAATKAGKKDTKGKKKSEKTKKQKDDLERLNVACKDIDKKRAKEILEKYGADPMKLQKFAQEYQKRYKKNLLEEIQPCVDEDLHQALMAILLPSDEYEAICLHQAMQGVGTDEAVLIEIICTKNNADIAALKKAYQKKYGKALKEEIKSETSGDFKNLLLKLLEVNRDESKDVDKKLAEEDAEALVQAGIKKWGTDEDKFIEIFTQRSMSHLQAVLVEYEKLANCEIEDSIEKEMSGNLQDGLLVLVACVQEANKPNREKNKALRNRDENKAKLVLGTKKSEWLEIDVTYNPDYDVAKQFGKTKDGKRLATPKTKGKNGKNGQNKKVNGKNGTANKTEKKETKDEKKKTEKKAEKQETPKKEMDDLEQLNTAVKGEDKKIAAEVLVKHGIEHGRLQTFAQEYQQRYKKDMLEDIQSNIDKDLYQALTAILLPSDEYDAVCLHQAMKGLGTDETVLIEIICTKNNSEIDAIKKVYQKKYGKSLEEDIKSETRGDFEDLLVKLLEGKRDESTEVDHNKVNEDAEALLKAGIKKWGTDEDKFIEIFTQRSMKHLQAMLPEYLKLGNSGMEDSIRSEMGGSLQDGLLALVACARDPSKFLADKLKTAIDKEDTDSLARLVLGTRKDTLVETEKMYNSIYKPNLATQLDKTKCNEDVKSLLMPRLTVSKDESP